MGSLCVNECCGEADRDKMGGLGCVVARSGIEWGIVGDKPEKMELCTCSLGNTAIALTTRVVS
jgi:hypothetical protein